MKKSIKRLPKRTQEELAVLQELILSNLSNVRMIIDKYSYRTLHLLHNIINLIPEKR